MKKSDLPTLPELRQKIDDIDVQLHALLRQRADIVHTVRKVKGKQPIFIRPGREASMIRALLKRPAGRIPAGLLNRIWREMIGAFTMQEGRLTVAVTAGKGQQDLWDITRDYYGATTPLIPYGTAAQAFAQVAQGKTELAVLPLPEQGAARPWWAVLPKESDLQIFAQFPFVLHEAAGLNGRGNRYGAWAVARLAPEPTGDDHGLLLIWGYNAKAMPVIEQALAALKPIAVHSDAAQRSLLITVGGLLHPEEKRVAKLATALAGCGARWRIAGGYAVPIAKNG